MGGRARSGATSDKTSGPRGDAGQVLGKMREDVDEWIPEWVR